MKKEQIKPLHKGFLNSIRLDSLKLRIPISIVDILDDSILAHYIEVNEVTGELTPEYYKTKFKEYTYSETSKIKVGIEKRITSEGRAEECLMVYLNSKVLKESYFEGLHIDNIKDVYDDIIKLNAFIFPYEVFLRSDCTDIDFKMDESMNQVEWGLLLDEFMSATLPSPQADKGYKRFKPTTKDIYNNGLQYNTRANATISRPFLKLYWKGGELMSKSKEFRDEHLSNLSDEEILQIVRIETTIKNKKHAKLLGIENVTLLGLLSLTETQKVSAFKQMLHKYLKRPNRQMIIDKVDKLKQMKPADQIYYVAILSLMEHTNGTPQEVIESLIQTIDGKVAKSRQKSHLNNIYEHFIKGSKQDIKSTKINSFFAKFEWLS